MITIKHALELRNFVTATQNSNSIFAFACLRMKKELDNKLSDFDWDYQQKKIEFSLKGKQGEVLINEKGVPLFDVQGNENLQRWYLDAITKEIDVRAFIASDYTSIKNNLFLLDLCNGLLVNVDLENEIK